MTRAAPLPPAGPGGPADATWPDHPPRTPRRTRLRLPAERMRALLWLGLLGAALLVLWLRLLATAPHLPLVLKADAEGQPTLVASSARALQPALGRRLQALVLPDGTRLEAGRGLLPQSARWTVDDSARRDLLAVRAQLELALQQPRLTAVFDGGLELPLAPQPRGLRGLGGLAWAVCALALGLYLAAAVVVLARPGLPARLYLVLATAQSLHLLLIAAGALPGLGQPGAALRLDPDWRLWLDGVTGAALVHVLALHPRQLVHSRAVGLAAWGVGLGGAAWLAAAAPAGLWWWAQVLALGHGLAAVLVLLPRQAQPRSPMARVLQRLVLAGMATLLLLCLALALDRHGLPDNLANLGTLAWMVFLASLLMLAPFLSRSRQVLREFALLAGVSTVAASLTLLLGTWGLHMLAALGLALALSLGLYSLARPWVLGQLTGPGTPSAERMFDSLYRAARALEQSPGEAERQLGGLLRDLFDPLELARSQRQATRVRVASDGAALVVPMPWPAGSPGARLGEAGAGALVLRHAQQGRRLFTPADAQLCERLLEQLRRAVAHDHAVEHGRAEERARIAQDLHDDIGARLLTLMYRAPNAEIEEYIRHTLQDLKTLTRGLAASDQRLSHAAAEWKADITQRLEAAGCSLQWSFSTDRDLRLTAVQWSGLTRVLRELVNNIITHAQASQVEIRLQHERGHLQLLVCDDGTGTAPDAWAHGLGLGGVRKRVKLLGGQVAWTVRPERGIRCEVSAPLGDDAGAAPAPPSSPSPR